MTTYNATYFIEKFKAIPDEQWTTGSFSSMDRTQHCALGHCGRVNSAHTTPEANSLTDIIYSKLHMDVVTINDGKLELGLTPRLIPMMCLKTPKARVLAALELCK